MARLSLYPYLFNQSDLDNKKYKIKNDRAVEFCKLFDSFLTFKSISIQNSESLAKELSKKAILIKDIARIQIQLDIVHQKNGESYSSILDFYQGLEELIHEVSIDDGVDAYAQTITYGLFLAKIQCQGELKREFVDHCLPRNIPIIQRIFRDIAGSSLPPDLTWIFDEILDVLNATDIKKILTDMDSRGKSDRDPFTFFYEDFLRLYDPTKRERRGVYYTPRPVVNYIVKSVEWILKNNFSKKMGFAEDDVTILDPAVGTGTFLWLVYLRTLGELKNNGLAGIMRNKIKTHLLKDFYGLEILITPYIIAHLKLSLILKRWNYELDAGERVQVYLTNSLEQGEEHLIPFMREINEERRIAHELVMKKPILAIIGNPPYSGHSANKGKWIDSLLKKGYKRVGGANDDGYYYVDSQPLGEKNPKWLQDDYVKFIRFAQWKIDQSGRGIVGFITNNAYLDNPTFRGMRQSLLNSFERIYILNLHGSSKRKEKSPDESKDENVFDIQQGTAIVLLVKNPEITDRKIKYFDLYGSRDDKYRWLDKNTLYSTEWQDLFPKSPFYWFLPIDLSLQQEYENFVKITDIFLRNNVGLITARDDLTIKWTEEEIWDTIIKFSRMNSEEARHLYKLGKDVRDWKIEFAQKDLIESGLSRDNIVPIRYRPFDIRFTYYTGRSRGFHCMPRYEIMKSMLKQNIGLYTCRQISGENWQHILITDKITDDCYVSNKTKERGYLFPLFSYLDDGTRLYNLNEKMIKELNKLYSREIPQEDIFFYIYGLLQSKKYRKRYEEFLKRDFPRIPFPNDYFNFIEISQLGKELADLHLMQKQRQSSVKFEISGSNIIELIKYSDSKVYINKIQYFDGIPENIWNYYVGSYHVLDKWLKYRKDKELTVHEILHFIQIVEVIKCTLRIMEEIDKIDFLP